MLVTVSGARLAAIGKNDLRCLAEVCKKYQHSPSCIGPESLSKILFQPLIQYASGLNLSSSSETQVPPANSPAVPPGQQGSASFHPIFPLLVAHITLPNGITQDIVASEYGKDIIVDVPVPLPAQFACTSCGYSTNEHRHLKQHWKQRCIEREIELRFVCQMCGQGFKNLRVANRHYLDHGEREVTFHRKMKEFVNNYKFKPEDLVRLQPHGWLSDHIVDFALAKACISNPAACAYAISALFLPDLRDFVNGKVGRQGGDYFQGWIFDAKLIFLPVNHGNVHWSLLVYEMDNTSVTHFDSLPSHSNTAQAQSIVNDLARFAREMLNDNRLATFSFVTGGCSKQDDAVNCGVYVVLNSVCFLEGGRAMQANQLDCANWRRKFLNELSNGSMESIGRASLSTSRVSDIIILEQPQSQPTSGTPPQPNSQPQSQVQFRMQTRSATASALSRASDTLALEESQSQLQPTSGIGIDNPADPHSDQPDQPADYLATQPSWSSNPTTQSFQPALPAQALSRPEVIAGSEPINWIKFAQGLQLGRVMERIPKGARPRATQILTDIIIDITSNESEISWARLFLFPSFCLSRPRRSIKHGNLTSYVKANLEAFASMGVSELLAPRSVEPTKVLRSKRLDLPTAVSKKFSEFDIKGAVRLVCENTQLAPKTQSTLTALAAKHPAPHPGSQLPAPPKSETALPVSVADVRRAIVTFPNGSSGGWEGLRPVHLRDLTAKWLGNDADKLIDALTRLSIKLLRGDILPSVAAVFFGARLISLKKKDGGIRPIAVGLTIRRLAAKICNAKIVGKANALFAPKQLGFGVKGGAEAAVHALRKILSSERRSDKIYLKIDYKNAFNSIRRDHMLREVHAKFPEVAPFLHSCYSNPGALFWSNEVIWSQEGVQQGDPLGPFLFCLGIHELVSSLSSPVNCWYMDDGSLVGDVSTVCHDLKTIINSTAKLGLQVNPSKCELSILSDSPDFSAASLSRVSNLARNIRVVDPENSELLGAPLHMDGVDKPVLKCIDFLKQMSINLEKLDYHEALFLLKNCLSMPKMTYLLRTAPCFASRKLAQYDSVLRSTLEKVLNISLSDVQWNRATLPVSKGGLGLRRTVDVALPAFIASNHSTAALSTKIFPCPSNALLDDALDRWDNVCPRRPEAKHTAKQREWDVLQVDLKVKFLLEDKRLCNFDKAGILAAKSPSSGAWLSAIPVPQLGLKLSNPEIRIAAGLRLGCDVVRGHDCVCGAIVDPKGIHALSCAKVMGRQARHAAVNRLIHSALNTAQFKSNLEPRGLCKDTNKRPDGITLVPWERGKSLVWDYSCVSTVADSNIQHSIKAAGQAAVQAEKRKFRKYEELSDRYIFVPIVTETFGVWGPAARKFVAALGHKIAVHTGESRSTCFLRQRIGIEIQRGNAACVLGTFAVEECEDDDFEFAVSNM